MAVSLLTYNKRNKLCYYWYLIYHVQELEDEKFVKKLFHNNMTLQHSYFFINQQIKMHGMLALLVNGMWLLQ